ncbi:MAG: hypothetical protein ACI8TX_002906 [Hyphomicrobiaceae bacterium]|jgi:hypothetical protein
MRRILNKMLRPGLALGAIFGLIAILALPAAALAQTTTLGAAPAPYYTSSPITVQVSATGFEETPQPEIAIVNPPRGGKLTLRGITPNVSTSMQIVNGQISTSKTVKFVYNFEFVAEKPGRYQIGPFKVTQGSTTSQTHATVFDVRNVPESPHQRIQLVLPEREIYVGERITTALEWWAESDMASNLYNQRAYLPLLSDNKHVRVLDPPVADSQGSLIIDTPSGAREFEASVDRRRADGKTWIVRSVPLIIIPLAPGALEVEAASLVVDEAVRWRRDFFGQRTPTQTRKLRSVDKDRQLVVKPIPVDGRPASFAGAVGSGFAIEVVADRTVIATGDPFTLTVSLRGDGTLENASLPPLRNAGLAEEHFATPTTPGAGIFDGTVKRFDVAVRVRNPDVGEVPPIQYSWFDPELEEFRTTSSDPIALSVREAVVVGADAVERSDTPATKTAQATGESPDTDTGKNRGIIYTLTGADLAVERSIDTLERNDRPGWGAWLLDMLLYLAGIVSLAGGYAIARNRAGDGGVGKRARQVETAVRGVDDAITATRLAGALRKLSAIDSGALFAGARRSELETLLKALDEVAYAPGGDEVASPRDLTDRARTLAHRIAEEVSR